MIANGFTQSARSRIKRTYDWSGAVSSTAIWTPAAGKSFIITDILISASAACTVTLVDGTAGAADGIGTATTEGARIMKYYFAANGGAVEDDTFYYSVLAGNSVNIITSATGGSITLFGFEN